MMAPDLFDDHTFFAPIFVFTHFPTFFGCLRLGGNLKSNDYARHQKNLFTININKLLGIDDRRWQWNYNEK